MSTLTVILIGLNTIFGCTIAVMIVYTKSVRISERVYKKSNVNLGRKEAQYKERLRSIYSWVQFLNHVNPTGTVHVINREQIDILELHAQLSSVPPLPYFEMKSTKAIEDPLDKTYTFSIDTNF